MRITGGSARGRTLITPQSDLIRPTCDRVREALFNILGQRVVGARVLDLFAGTGALGIEALSRGASYALFVDNSLAVGRLIEANLRTCISQPHGAFLLLNLATTPHLRRIQASKENGGPFDLVFMDPPYQKNLAHRVLALMEKADIFAEGALVVVEEHRNASLPGTVASLALIDHRRYGETGLWFYEASTA